MASETSDKKINMRVPQTPQTDCVLTKDALTFLAELEAKFGQRRLDLLKKRKERQKRYNAGEKPNFNPETAHIREADWSIAPVPEVLQDRRVEITGPVDRKMMINALNSGAKIFMGDFEDATAPNFDNIIQGQINVIDYANGELEYTDPHTGKEYSVDKNPALMIVRPRGLHLDEAHLEIDGRPLSGSFVDFGLHIFNTGKTLAKKNMGPFYYIPKLESHLEARLWNDIFVYAQERLGIPHGTIKATVLIETLPAAFEMDEILYELKDHVAGLNCGRWDYIFSYIKTLRNHPDYILPNRADVTMDQHFLKAYCVLLIKTCHKRGAHAMGGMAAQIPIKNDPEANEDAIEKVRADKLREAKLMHDGTWVAHPALVKPAMKIFDEYLTGPNNIDKDCPEETPSAKELLIPHRSNITPDGIRMNINVALQYISAWLDGRGAVPIHNLMEDMATAEICRVQLWQWIKFGAPVKDDNDEAIIMTRDFFEMALDKEFDALSSELSNNQELSSHLQTAKAMLHDIVLSEELTAFIPQSAYKHLTTIGT